MVVFGTEDEAKKAMTTVDFFAAHDGESIKSQVSVYGFALKADDGQRQKSLCDRPRSSGSKLLFEGRNRAPTLFQLI